MNVWANILIALLVALLTIPSAIYYSIGVYDRVRAWREGKPVPLQTKAIGRWWPVFSTLVGVAVAALIWQRPLPTGFHPGWPDAIQCPIELPEMAGSEPYVFHYLGIMKGRQNLSDVIRYFIPSGKGGIHELWFTNDADKLFIRRILNPQTDEFALKLRDRIILRKDLDSYAQSYMDRYPDDPREPINCGGDSIGAIEKAGNAFVFATQLK